MKTINVNMNKTYSHANGQFTFLVTMYVSFKLNNLIVHLRHYLHLENLKFV